MTIDKFQSVIKIGDSIWVNITFGLLDPQRFHMYAKYRGMDCNRKTFLFTKNGNDLSFEIPIFMFSELIFHEPSRTYICKCVCD